MNLKPLAFACAVALGGPAFAQSTVTLYGVLDGGVLSISNVSGGRLGYVPSTANGGRSTQFKDGGIGGSFWGLRGKEDLGGGWGASFQLQGNINVKDGSTGGPNSTTTTSFFNQFSTVGLSGPFGEVKVGRQVSPMYYAMAATDARAARYFGSVLTGLVAMNSASGAWIGNNSNVAFGTVYNDDAIVYTTPTWHGLTANLEDTIGNTAGSSKANSQRAATLVYGAGGLRLSALYYTGFGNDLPAATTISTLATGSAAAGAAAAAAAGFSPTANTNRLTSLGALYTRGAWTVSTSFFEARNPAHATLPGGSASLDMWTVGAGWKPSGPWNVTAGYYAIKDKTNAGHKATQFAIGAEYSFSARTMVYVEAAQVTNRGANMNLSPIYATPVTADMDVHALMAGLRHSF
jgi:predicted porin